MNSINEMVLNVVQTVRATYDYFVEIVHEMLTPTPISEDNVTINVTQTSGSEQTIVVTRPEKKAVPAAKPGKVASAIEKVKAEIKKSEQNVKPAADKKTFKTETITKRYSTGTAPPISKVDTPSGPIGNKGPVTPPVLAPPTKHEVGTDAAKITPETTSPKCTRCVEKNVFCNQECPNTNNTDRID